MKSYLPLSIFIIISMVMLQACTRQNPCLINQAINANISFKKINDSLVVKDTILVSPAISNGTLTYLGFKTNSIRFALPSNVGQFNFLFNADTSTQIIDTITLDYTKELNYISKECGFNYFYKIQKLQSTKKSFKNIVLIDSLINDNAEKINFNIIF